MYRVLLVLLLAGSCFAQEFRGTLAGRVIDPSGAAVPNAKVVVIKTDTNSRSETVSGGDGNYSMPFLAPGTYEVQVEVAGFKKYSHPGIRIGANERIAEEVRLEVGSSAETIMVTAEAPLLNLMTASSGQVVATRDVENLPMNGNTPLSLARNALGVIPKQKNLLLMVKPYNTSSPVDIAMGGANSGSNEYLLDGVPNMSSAARAGGFSPSMDAVEEVKVELFQADAAYGDTLGGTVNIITKSGTNDFHGSLYEFNQTSALAANQFFLNAASQKRVVSRSNQYGGSLGGPVRIPKLFNGKDKLFFMFAYEGFKDSTPGMLTTSVPTDAERTGDFSALLAINSSYQLYDPATAVLSGSRITRQPFAGNRIPSSRFNSIAQKYMQYFPGPTQAGRADGANNFVVANPSINNFASWVGRTDVNISTRNKLFFKAQTSAYTQSSSDIFHNLATGQYSGMDLWGTVLDDVHMFSPTLVMDTRLGITRSYNYSSIKSGGMDPTTLGFPSYMKSFSQRLAMPRVTFSDGYAGMATAPGTVTPFTSSQLMSTVSKVFGNVTVKTGVDIRRYDANTLNPGNSAGAFTMGTNYVNAGTGAANPTFGGSLATFLLGLPTAGNYDVNTAFAYRSYLYGFFLQTDWRIRPNMTINLGMRFEHESALVERYNRIVSGFDPQAVNSVATAAAAAYAASPISQLPVSSFSALGGLKYASANNRSGYDLPTVFPSPRFGITWAPGKLHNKTVFRGGFGVFNNSIGAYLTGPTTGFSQSTTLIPSNDSFVTPYATLSDPFPGGSIQNPAGNANGVNSNLGNGISFYNSHITNPYSIRWSVDLQQQLAKSVMLQVGYVGNKQVHGTLSNATYLTPLLPFLSKSATRDQATINALSAVVSNPFRGLLPGTTLNSNTVSVATLLRAYPQYTSVVTSNLNPGWGTFNELVVMLQKRFSHGLSLTANYQHSRQLNSYQANEGDFKLSYGVTSGDYPDHIAISGSYDLPFGQGRHFLRNTNRVVDLAIGGWVLNTIFTWESGSAVQLGNIIYYGGDLNMQPRNLTQAFDVTRFERATAAQLQNNYRTFPQMFNDFRSDVANNFDISLMKNFRIKERLTAQLRFETFNTMNRTQFAAPNVTPNSSAFGTITGQGNVPRSVQMALKLKF